uniref:Uncharacterized protein n=1 Tax=Chromera velia CCMP2878 TaxID=1169474 RepID=A0A0G4GCV6_9ALVE|eukprot:Cvel_21288.t1-p1 / transcript=Cvel_21288.t1 / gene=Cvel_21288 / organism=Chromera_velia_CCMP2878 / gene_product=hypothetical protein / transcript_product=hypothetical protein / location=Cvel_scaffold1982:24948-26510(+) / protein_length=521 / sequence_SO=supercontig / SO=protein_coding / is_pseudo=false
MLRALQLACLCLAASHVQTYPHLESAAPQTPVQKQLIEEALEASRLLSDVAAPHVEELFSHPATQAFIVSMDPNLARESPANLIRRFWAEIDAAEIVHAFGDGSSPAANCGFDLTTEIGRELDYFPNQWELQALKKMPVDPVNNRFMEWSETNIFHFPPFKNTSQPGLRRSLDRPVYAAVNMYRASGGNPQCGPITAVFSRRYIGNQLLSAPLDTGFFNGECRNGEATGAIQNKTIAICSAWPKPWPIGVPPFMNHFVEPYLRFFNATQPRAGPDFYPHFNLARLLVRLLGSTYRPAPPPGPVVRGAPIGPPKGALGLNFLENTLGYFELNPAVRLRFADGIVLLIAMFELLWGSPAGRDLLAWCEERGWPLAWAHNPVPSYWRCGPAGEGPECSVPDDLAADGDAANVRLLDPRVLTSVPAGHNVTVPSAVSAAFVASWEGLDVSRAPSRSVVAAAWDELVASSWQAVGIEPVFAGACNGDCAGVLVGREERHCVCIPVENKGVDELWEEEFRNLSVVVM